MLSILDKDSSLPSPSVMLVPASAGSGKTFTLTLKFVQLLLSDRIANGALGNILAVTFTNNAASEMRQRVITALKKLVISDPKMTPIVAEVLDAPSDDIRRKAAVALEQIFACYSDFQVRTIDSFMSRVFKASALEFGYNPEFELLLDHHDLLDYTFDVFARDLKAGTEKAALFRTLTSLIRSSSAGKSFLWNPYGKITEEVRRLLLRLSMHSRPIQRAHVEKDIELLAARLRAKASRMQAVIDEHNLPGYSLLMNDLALASRGEWQPLIEARSRRDKVLNKPPKKVSPSGFEALKSGLDGDLAEYNTILGDLAIAHALNCYEPYAIALEQIADTLERAKKQRGQLFIEDINRQLIAHLDDGAVPEVYVRLGNRTCHYLIDEFQDTSPIQWEALVPLIDNSLAVGGSLFLVGDPKQSIYSFRGADWRIMKGVETGELAFASAKTNKRMLDTNRRSLEAIVRYGERVFSSAFLTDDYREAASDSGLLDLHQEVLDEHRGQGHVEFVPIKLDGSEDEEEEQQERSNPVREHVLEIIRSATARGHGYGDIVILTYDNRTVVQLSGWLNEAQIPFISHSSLDIRTRRVTGEITALLSFLDSPIDDLSFATFLLGRTMEAVCQLHFPSATPGAFREIILQCRNERTRPLYTAFRERFPAVWESYLEPLYSVVGYLPLYSLVVEIYKVFGLFDLRPAEEAALVKLLEVVKNFEEGGTNNLKDFLEFAADEEDASSDWNIDPPAGAGAVTLMTIHKSKGLQFPVVIGLLKDRREKGDSLLVREDATGLRLMKVTQKMTDKHELLESVYAGAARRRKTDALNQLYVVLTRAIEEMYVISISGKKPGMPSGLLVPSEQSADNRPLVRRDVPAPHRLLTPYHPAIRQAPAPQDPAKIGHDETQRGDYLHAALSLLEYIDGDPGELMLRSLNAMPQGPMDVEAAALILSAFLRESGIAGLFCRREGRRILNEYDLVDRSGALFRVDRLVVDEDAVTVIDFKTGRGEMEERYIGQVRNYMVILADLFPGKAMHGLLAYIDTKTLTPVEATGA